MAGSTGGRSPRRSTRGQHFLSSDPFAARLVADANMGRDDQVVEIGAGTGRLTAALARCAGHVFAIELDDSLTTGLARRFARTANVSVHQGDALTFPLPATRHRVFANPPWDHTARILHRLLDDPGDALVRADLVLQWQVARARAQVERDVPADLLGALWGPWWQFARGRRVPAALFRPRPAVDGGVLTITRRTPPRLPMSARVEYTVFVRERYEPGVSLARWIERFTLAARVGTAPSRHRRR